MLERSSRDEVVIAALRRPARMATGAVFPQRRTDDRRPGLARRHRALARRLRRPRRRSGGAVRRDAALDVIGFWNATIGLLIMRFARDPVAAVTPVAGRVRGDEPITASTAILLCIRNEPPERVARMLAPMMEGLAARGVGERFHVYVLSDTSEARDRRGRGRVLRGARSGMARAHRGHLPASRRQYRLQGRQHPRFLRALGQGARLRRDARRRQRHDGRPPAHARAHHADRSAARHPAEPGHRHALDQRLRPHLPVRHAAGHALLHHRQRLVAGRLRTVLGPQRHRAHRAVHGALRAAGADRQRAGERPRAQPRPGRGGADAARRLRGARAGGGRLELRAEPADPDRIHPPRPALVPGQHAVLAFPAHARPAAREPLSARSSPS